MTKHGSDKRNARHGHDAHHHRDHHPAQRRAAHGAPNRHDRDVTEEPIVQRRRAEDWAAPRGPLPPRDHDPNARHRRRPTPAEMQSDPAAPQRGERHPTDDHFRSVEEALSSWISRQNDAAAASEPRGEAPQQAPLPPQPGAWTRLAARVNEHIAPVTQAIARHTTAIRAKAAAHPHLGRIVVISPANETGSRSVSIDWSAMQALLQSTYVAFKAFMVSLVKPPPHNLGDTQLVSAQAAADEAAVRHGLQTKLTAGYIYVAVFVFGILGYSAFAQIRGAVIAQGNMVVEGNLRRVQHQDGGSVAEIRVHNGQHVKAGDLLVRLDDTSPRAELGVVMVQLYGQQVRTARLIAERDNLPDVSFPPPPSFQGFEKDSNDLVAVEKSFFFARRRARDGEISQLKERSDQIQQEIEGLTAQLRATEAQSAVTRDELEGLEKLLKQGLTQLSRINPQRLNLAQLEGKAGDIKAQIARARGRISENGIQVAQINRQMLNDVSGDLRESSEKIAGLHERRLAAEAKLKRIEIRAPIEGTVHQLAVFTIGGVLAPGDTVMQIVPEGEKLLVESKIDPQFIDQVSVGQDALVRFSSFDQRTTPELNGKVVFVSADLEQDARQQGPGYFRARVELDKGEAERLSDQRITSGLPAELHLRTRQRTIMSYFLKPMTDQIARTFRER